MPREPCPCHTNPNRKRALEGTWAGRDPQDPGGERVVESFAQRDGDAHMDTPCQRPVAADFSVDSTGCFPSDAVSGSNHIQFPQNPFCRLGPGSQRAGTDFKLPKAGDTAFPRL